MSIIKQKWDHFPATHRASAQTSAAWTQTSHHLNGSMRCVRTFPAKPDVSGANHPGAALKVSVFGTGDEDSGYTGVKPHLSSRPDETAALKLPSSLE